MLKFYTSGEILPNDNIALSAGYYLIQTNPAGPTEFYVDYIQGFMETFQTDVDTVCGTLSSTTVTSGEISSQFQTVNNKFLGAELKPYQIDIEFTSDLTNAINLFSQSIATSGNYYVNCSYLKPDGILYAKRMGIN